MWLPSSRPMATRTPMSRQISALPSLTLRTSRSSAKPNSRSRAQWGQLSQIETIRNRQPQRARVSVRCSVRVIGVKGEYLTEIKSQEAANKRENFFGGGLLGPATAQETRGSGASGLPTTTCQQRREAKERHQDGRGLWD